MLGNLNVHNRNPTVRQIYQSHFIGKLEIGIYKVSRYQRSVIFI